MTKPSQRQILFILLCAALALASVPTQASKAAGGLHLNEPVETPDGVFFSWINAEAGTSYSLYRRRAGTAGWERIALNLTGEVGVCLVPGFTLDATYEYELRAQEPQ